MTVRRVTLPEPPNVELETQHETRMGEGGFLTLRRVELVAIQESARSKPFTYDLVDRRALDACVMAAHHVRDGRVWVWLRSSVRPPVGLRADRSSTVLWELPAGLIEPGESPRAAAARELAEELGFDRPEGAFFELGPTGFPAPACIGEVHHFFRVEVDPTAQREPEGDGSPVESGARVMAVPLDDALEAARRGELRDEKTELALRRLAEVLP